MCVFKYQKSISTRILLAVFVFFFSFNCFAQAKENDTEEETTPELIIDQFIQPFLFEFNSVSFKENERLEKICEVFNKWKVKSILLTGHCSESEFKIHPSLSRKRAEKIKNLMIDYGIKPEIIEIKDYNKKQSKDSDCNNVINQRVELIILEE